MARAQSICLPPELQALLGGLSSAAVADSQAWILTLMRRQGLTVLTMLWRMLGSEPDVMDAYQAAVCKLTARGKDGAGRNPSAYFYRTAMNAGIEILRARKRQREHWPGLVDVQRCRDARRTDAMRGGLDQQEMVDRMVQAVFRLPPRLRGVVILRDLAELPYREVAGILGIGAGTARLYRRQAVVQLADLLRHEVNR